MHNFEVQKLLITVICDSRTVERFKSETGSKGLNGGQSGAGAVAFGGAARRAPLALMFFSLGVIPGITSLNGVFNQISEFGSRVAFLKMALDNGTSKEALAATLS